MTSSLQYLQKKAGAHGWRREIAPTIRQQEELAHEVRFVLGERRVMSFHWPLRSYSRLTETFALESLQIHIANSSDCSKISLSRLQPGPVGIYKTGCKGDRSRFTKALFRVKPLAFPGMVEGRAQETSTACTAWQ